MAQQILGKYEILENLEPDSFGNECFRVSAGFKEWGEFILTKVARTESNEYFSFKAQSLSNLSHKNLLHFKVEEDEKYFYFLRHLGKDVREFSYRAFCDDCDSGESRNFANELLASENDYESALDYVKFFECTLQIIDALKYIHQRGSYHGNLNPSTILLDNSNRVFLLDFGKSYFYAPFVGDSHTSQAGLELSARFYAPEQLGFLESKALSVGKESDIFSFGLCMLQLLLDSWGCDELQSYTKPQDLDSIFEAIFNSYKFDNTKNELLLLVRKCCAFLPENRIKLHELERELCHLYDKFVPKNVYELRCHNNTTIERYAANNGLDSSDLESIMHNIQERIKGHHAYARQFEEISTKTGEPESKLEFAINDVVFVCSAMPNDDSYLWVWQIRENESTRIENIINEGIELRHTFVFVVEGYRAENKDISSISSVIKLKRELDLRFKQAEFERKRKKIDKIAIVSEEDLLAAEKRDIEEKKQTKLFQYIGVNTGADELTFKLIEKDSKNTESNDENEAISTEISLQVSRTIRKETKAFKPNEEVIIQEASDLNNLFAESIKGKVTNYKPDTKELTIKCKEKYETLNRQDGESKALSKKAKYAISYDYQVREILWSKRNKALEELQNGNTKIPNLLRKINEPKELQESSLREIVSYFNDRLDENQQEAVKKALSLESDCEILLIQGPPGTGKTTTITEIIKQYQKLHKHFRILITSQSNQAVDNVLEKIATSENNPNGEDKLFRIGNDESKINAIAKDYVPQKVLDKILKENLARIKNNPITDSNPNIQKALESLQQDFETKLQTLSNNLSRKGIRNQKMFGLFTKDIRLFFGTLIGISSWKSFRDVDFDVAIVDEAGRATLSELLVPNVKARRIILVGDHKQLAPVVDDDVVIQLDKDSKKREKKDLSHEEFEAFKATKKEVTTSLFERLFMRIENASKEKPYLEHFKHTLTYNYRAHKSICDLYSEAFYDGKLQTKDAISAQKLHNLKAFRVNAVWLDTNKRSDKEDKQSGTGKINHCNADMIFHTLKVLERELIDSHNLVDSATSEQRSKRAQNVDTKKVATETICDDFACFEAKGEGSLLSINDRALSEQSSKRAQIATQIQDIGIITPYKAQAALLKSKLSSLIKAYQNANIRVDIGTVDSFQGSDRDMIIYDCVRSSKVKNTTDSQKQRKGSKIDFIADEKRLNVSLSRAKKLLVIVGDKEYLQMASVSDGENPFSKIIEKFESDSATYQIIELQDSKK